MSPLDRGCHKSQCTKRKSTEYLHTLLIWKNRHFFMYKIQMTGRHSSNIFPSLDQGLNGPSPPCCFVRVSLSAKMILREHTSKLAQGLTTSRMSESKQRVLYRSTWPTILLVLCTALCKDNGYCGSGKIYCNDGNRECKILESYLLSYSQRASSRLSRPV